MVRDAAVDTAGTDACAGVGAACSIECISERSVMLDMVQMADGRLMAGPGDTLLVCDVMATRHGDSGVGVDVRRHFVEDCDLACTPAGRATPEFAGRGSSIARQLWPLWRGIANLDPFGPTQAVTMVLPSEWKGSLTVDWSFQSRISRQWMADLWTSIDAGNYPE